MKLLHVACFGLTTLISGYVATQAYVYDTISGHERIKTYVYTETSLFGDLVTPSALGPIEGVHIAYESTLVYGGSFVVKAALWNGNFQNRLNSVGYAIDIPPLMNPNVPEVWLLNFPMDNISLDPGYGVYGISTVISPSSSVRYGYFVPLFGNNPTRAGVDYNGFSLDTNHNGVLEPNLPIPNAEWYNPSPTWSHANLICGIYVSTAKSASAMPRFTAKKIDLQTYRLQTLLKAADPLGSLR